MVTGDSLCQLVLDDELLVVGKEHNPGFQILHALHSFEQAILALKNRDCNFEIVFFDCENCLSRLSWLLPVDHGSLFRQ
jgi:hypothetical protein